jgi:hypothetical protein
LCCCCSLYNNQKYIEVSKISHTERERERTRERELLIIQISRSHLTVLSQCSKSQMSAEEATAATGEGEASPSEYKTSEAAVRGVADILSADAGDESLR